MMYVLVLVIGIILGLILYKKFPKCVRTWFPDLLPRSIVYEIQFRISWLSQPSLFNEDINGELIKTKPITVRVEAINEEEALANLHELLLQEVKPDLITIKEIND